MNFVKRIGIFRENLRIAYKSNSVEQVEGHTYNLYNCIWHNGTGGDPYSN